MRILALSIEAIPGLSGGWTSMSSLLHGHATDFIVGRGAAGEYLLDNTRVHCPVSADWQAHSGQSVWNRILPAYTRWRRSRAIIKKSTELWRNNYYDFVFCRDIPIAEKLTQHGIGPIVLDLLNVCEGAKKRIETIRSNLAAVITQHPSSVADWVRPHAIEIDDYRFCQSQKAEKSLLVSVLTYRQDPCLYICAAAASKLPGYIIGDGEFRKRVQKACRGTDGKVSWLRGIPHAEMKQRLSEYQVGVAALSYLDNPFQIKVIEYLAAGLVPVVPTESWLAKNAPHLCYTYDDGKGLTSAINEIADKWPKLGPQRLAGRSFAQKNFSAKKMRQTFLRLLQEKLR